MMVEVLAILGGISAAAQIVEGIVEIITSTKRLHSDIKNGGQALLEKVAAIQELVDTMVAIRLEPELSATVNPHVTSCLKDAISIRDYLRTIATSCGNAHPKRLKLGIHWNSKKKKIARMCANLEEKKSTLLISMQNVLPLIYEQLATINQNSPELFSKVSTIEEKVKAIYEELQPGAKV
jgi:hypothetical protein